MSAERAARKTCQASARAYQTLDRLKRPPWRVATRAVKDAALQAIADALDAATDSIVAANWDSLVFDVGDEPLRRVPMMEPSRGTEAHVGRLLDECTTPAELVARLSQ